MDSINQFFSSLFGPAVNQVFFGNTILTYSISVVLFILFLIIILIIDHILLKKLEKIAAKTDNPIDDFIVGLVEKNIFPLFYYGGFYLATRNLTLSEMLNKVVNGLGVVILAVFAIRFFSSGLKYWLLNYVFKEDKRKERATIKGLFPVFNTVIWAIGIIFLLDNLGFNISAVIAGLGIGGIAIALAAQNILGDLFSYFCMLFDHPFVIGDFIIIGDYMGTVEKIGIKTTRIRSLSGEQIVFPNTDLTGSRIRNYKRMENRRIVFTFGVTYETPLDKLQKIPEIVKNVAESIDKIQFDRAHFAKYGDFSLNFEVVYIVLNSDYNLYMDIQQEINYKLFEQFSKENIEFAYPTQTLFVKKEGN
ncbi:MAG: mechanosensitive ion channel family protein [Spirochaetes bacterium]|nr:mechanosensitive ion channel family protein [Spirochaetota bacterium]